VENFGYPQLNSLWKLIGLYRWMVGKDGRQESDLGSHDKERLPAQWVAEKEKPPPADRSLCKRQDFGYTARLRLTVEASFFDHEITTP